MGPVFLLCFTDSVHGSTGWYWKASKLSKACLPARSWTAVLSSALLHWTTFFHSSRAEKSFSWINFTAGFESLPPPRQLNLQKKGCVTQQKVNKSTTKSLKSNRYKLQYIKRPSTWTARIYFLVVFVLTNSVRCDINAGQLSCDFGFLDLSIIQAPVWSWSLLEPVLGSQVMQ